MHDTKYKAFTLVELIVVVTILAILATIWFVSYSSYLTWVRDTNRLAQLVSIHDGLELYRTRNDLPLPDDNVEVQASGAILAYQWYVWSNTLETIDFTKWGKDPKDDAYFSYYLTKDRKYFQLLAFLEEEENITSSLHPTGTSLYEGGYVSSPSSRGMSEGQGEFRFVSSTFAVDYTDRIPVVYGKKLWILTSTSNTPIHEIITEQIDLVMGDTTNYVAYLSDSSTMTWATAWNSHLEYLVNTLLAWWAGSSCKTTVDRNKNVQWKDGIYIMAPEWVTPFPVYCDMTTNGWWWMLIANIDSTALRIIPASFEDWLWTVDLESPLSGDWILDADNYYKDGTIIKTDFSWQYDYFKPINGANIKEMLMGFTKHQRADAYNGDYITPDHYTTYLWWSDSYYPRDFIDWDSRTFLPFWWNSTTSWLNSWHDWNSWNQTYELYVQ